MFQAGDRVKRIGPNHQEVRTGNTYTVRRSRQSGQEELELQESLGVWYKAEFFVRVAGAALSSGPALRVGDRVILTRNRSGLASGYVGQEATVIELGGGEDNRNNWAGIRTVLGHATVYRDDLDIVRIKVKHTEPSSFRDFVIQNSSPK